MCYLPSLEPPPVPIINTSSLPAKSPKVVMFGLGLAAALGLLFCFNPASTQLYPPCPLHALAGLYCPGCGSLRAVHQLLHGHVRAAFGYNPVLLIILPFLGALSWKGVGFIGLGSHGLRWWYWSRMESFATFPFGPFACWPLWGSMNA